MTPEQARELEWGDKLRDVKGNRVTFVGIDPHSPECLVIRFTNGSVGTFYCGEFEKVREPAVVYINEYPTGFDGMTASTDIASATERSHDRAIRTAVKFVEVIEDASE
jgi:hypothetical protein